MADEVSCKDRDKAVLESIFNPYLPLGTASADDINEETPVEETAGDIHAEKAKEYEISGVERAERGDLDGAMECFNMAIEAASNRASGYNNRAQLWRLKGRL